MTVPEIVVGPKPGGLEPDLEATRHNIAAGASQALKGRRILANFSSQFQDQ